MASLEDFRKEWYGDEEYILAHTSGSTGKPKEIRLLKADMLTSARATNAFFGLCADSRAALPLAMDYIAGKMMAVRAWEGSYPLDILAVSNDIELPDNGCRYSIIPVVPSQLPSLISKREYSSRIDNVLIGGAAPDRDICRKLIENGYKAYISYGMTETCSHVALCDAADADRIYRAMPGISFSADADGCLVIEAPDFSFRRLETNDIVELGDAKSFRWLGRRDNVINTGGIKLLCEELEKMYAPLLPGVSFYVARRSHEKWGECIGLVVEAPADADECVALLRDKLDHRYCPLSADAVAALPRTPNGKIIRR